MTFNIYNTLTRKKQELKTIEKGIVKIYSCGPTVYNYAHIGNWRSFVFSDLLRRYLKFKGYDVKHVMNITDVDDKTIRDSQKNFSKIQGNYIIFKISDKHDDEIKQKYISKQLQKLLAKHHHGELYSKIHKLNQEHFGKDINKVCWKYTKSRWGACHCTRKEIEISTKLLFAPMEILEYVIIHELAHLIEANHSKRFWNIVKSCDPNYKKKIKWLHANGNELQI